MRTDDNPDVSYDRLNALVDGELDRADEARVLEAIRRDPGLEQRACELRQTKSLVRHAYQHEAPSRRAHPHGLTTRRRALAAAAVALVALGVGAGWTGHAWQHRTQDADYWWLVRGPGALTQAAATGRVVLHISSSAPERVTGMLDDAEGMLRAARESGRTIAIEVVANSSGLDVLRLDVPGEARRLEALRAEFPNLTLVACAQTMERLREKGITPRLLPDAVTATSALDRIVQRIHEGWTYVRA